MKIIHTSDWHLGKRLSGKNRLEEQRLVIDEIADVCKNEAADVLIVAGDVFDTFVPPAEAEELFYAAVKKISDYCIPAVIAGNHDDALRLSAARGLAKASGILLLSDGQREETFEGDFALKRTRIQTGENFVRITRGGETLNLGYLGYPSSVKLADMAGNEDYSLGVEELIKKACSGFTKDDFNVFAAHLFLTGAEDALSGERELGGSKLLPKSVLPSGAAYTALGHVHKPLTVSKTLNACYSGSPMQLSFDDKSDKRVIKVDFEGGKVTTESIPLHSYKKLVVASVASEDEALAALEKHADCYVRIEYVSHVPLSPRAVSEFKKHPCFAELVATVPKTEKKAAFLRRGKTDAQLFEMFYKAKCNAQPDEKLTDVFLKAVAGEEL